MSKNLSVHEAKAHFSYMLNEVETGSVFVITKHDKPVAEVRAVSSSAKTPVLGAFASPVASHLEVSWTDEELGELFGS